MEFTKCTGRSSDGEGRSPRLGSGSVRHRKRRPLISRGEAAGVGRRGRRPLCFGVILDALTPDAAWLTTSPYLLALLRSSTALCRCTHVLYVENVISYTLYIHPQSHFHTKGRGSQACVEVAFGTMWNLPFDVFFFATRY